MNRTKIKEMLKEATEQHERAVLRGDALIAHMAYGKMSALTSLLAEDEVEGWISVEERLPEEYQFRMSKDVLTLSGTKYSVKCYDFELKRWSGSPHVTVTKWKYIDEASQPQKGEGV